VLMIVAAYGLWMVLGDGVSQDGSSVTGAAGSSAVSRLVPVASVPTSSGSSRQGSVRRALDAGVLGSEGVTGRDGGADAGSAKPSDASVPQRDARVDAVPEVVSKSLIKDAQVALDRGKTADAIAKATKYTEAYPEDAFGWVILAESYNQIGKRAEGREAYRRCTEVASKGPFWGDCVRFGGR